MGLATRLLQFGLSAAVGTGRGLAAHYEAIRQEQEYLAKLREERALEEWRLGAQDRRERERLGLQDRLERGRIEWQRGLPSTAKERADIGQSEASTEESRARSSLYGAQAAALPGQTEADLLRARSGAQQENRQDRQFGLKEREFQRENPDRPAGFEEAETSWLEESTPLEAAGQIVNSYLLGRKRHLSHDPKSPWYSSAFAKTAAVYGEIQKIVAEQSGPKLTGMPGSIPTQVPYYLRRPEAPISAGVAVAEPSPLGAGPARFISIQPDADTSFTGNHGVLGMGPPAPMPLTGLPPEARATSGVGPRTARMAQRAVDQGKAKSIEEAIDAMRKAGANVSL